MNGENGSLLVRVLSNRNIQLGFIFLTLALIFAFIGAIPEVKTSTPDKTTIKQSDSRAISGSYTATISKLIFNYTSEDPNATAVIWFEDGYPYEDDSSEIDIEWKDGISSNITLNPGDDLKFDLENLEETPKTVNFNLTSGELKYEHNLEYQTKPYGLLSFPALVFLLLGMVFAFRGKGVITAEIKRKRMEEKQRSKKASKEEKQKEKAGEKEEDVIYPGPGKSKQKGKQQEGEADHIDFMGLPEDSEEDEEDK